MLRRLTGVILLVLAVNLATGQALSSSTVCLAPDDACCGVAERGCCDYEESDCCIDQADDEVFFVLPSQVRLGETVPVVGLADSASAGQVTTKLGVSEHRFDTPDPPPLSGRDRLLQAQRCLI